MIILIINKNYAKQNVFNVFISENVTTAKTCCRFMSEINRKKMISTEWNFFKSQTVKFVKQFKKRFSIWLKRFRRNSSLLLNDEAYVFSEIAIAQLHKVIKNRQIRIRQIIDYESWDFEDFAIMNLNNLSAKKRFVFFEAKNRNEDFLQIKTIQFQITKNLQQKKNRIQNVAIQKSIQSSIAMQKSLQFWFAVRNSVADQSTSRTNDARNIFFYDFANVFLEQNIAQKQSNFAEKTSIFIANDIDRLLFKRIDRIQISENDQKEKNSFQSNQRR